MKHDAKLNIRNIPGFGNTVVTTAVCSQTMEWAKSILATSPHGTLLQAKKVTAARGRHGRTWTCMPGQLLATYIIKPEAVSCDITSLYYALNLGICTALQAYCSDVAIAWPNDMVLNKKKLGGMLLEPVWHGTHLAGLILGVGINITTIFPQRHPLFSTAISLVSSYNRQINIETVQHTLNQELTHWYTAWLSGKHEVIWNTWRNNHLSTGSPIACTLKNGTIIKGNVAEVHRNGTLTIQSESGLQKIDFHMAL